MTRKTFSPTTRTYTKPNFVEVYSKLVPQLYFDEDYQLSGTQVNPVSQLINSQLNLALNFNTIFNVSAVGALSAINTFSGVSKYFIKQNRISEISPFEFERDILSLANSTFRDFESSAAFASYVSSTLIPTMELNNPSSIYGAPASAAHEYLANSLSWLYFLNMSAAGRTYEPSNVTVDLITKKLYKGQDITLGDCMEGVHEFLWRNLPTCSIVSSTILPTKYLSGTGEYVSGTQQLSALKTLVDVIYSPNYTDSQDFRLADAFNDYIDIGTFLSDRTNAGPFRRFLEALGYSLADMSDEIEKLDIIYDIEECPEEFLPLLGEIIGWRFFGYDEQRWRLQLKNAIDIYKSKGTKKSLQYAVDSIFTPGVFNLSSNISELWESYIPHLAYYALATESPYFKDINTWTRDLAIKTNVIHWTPFNLDENIRNVVDHILLDLWEQFPDHFIIGHDVFDPVRIVYKSTGKIFKGTPHITIDPVTKRIRIWADKTLGEELERIGKPDFIFKYRNKNYQLPPFEEAQWYYRCIVSHPLVDRLIYKLKCFGVTETFADQVGAYIKRHWITLEDDEVINVKRGFLGFTSSVQVPPNFTNVITLDKRPEALDLWSGKSSHFRASFQATSFDFGKTTTEADAGLAVLNAAKVTKEFSPAHSIPLIEVILSALDDYVASDKICPIVSFSERDNFEFYASSRGFSRFETSAVSMLGWHRDVSSGNVFDRKSVDTLLDPLLRGTSSLASSSTTSAISTLPRNTFRRRNYKQVLPTRGFYSRTGFNMPIGFDASTISHFLPSSLGFAPLGLIPSSLSYESISSIHNLPRVYYSDVVSSLASSFYGVAASAYFPCRGTDNLNGESCDYYVDRGQLAPIMAYMFLVFEAIKELKAFHTVSSNPDVYPELSSIAYEREIASNDHSYSSLEDYYNFSFGRGIHQYFEYYCKQFGRHAINTDYDTISLGGKNILTHTFGPLIQNGYFNTSGDVEGVYSPSPSALVFLSNSGIFNAGAVGLSGVYSAASGSQMAVVDLSRTAGPNFEYRSSGILSGADFIQTIGGSDYNLFSLLKFQGAKKETNDFYENNEILLLKAINGLPRIRFRVCDNDNLLLPEHDFRIETNAAVFDSIGSIFGGAKLGCWIHTQQEQNAVWSYNKDGQWVQTSSQNLTKDHVLNDLTHFFTFPEIKLSGNKDKNKKNEDTACLGTFGVDQTTRINPFAITRVEEDDYTKVTFGFSTKNNFCPDWPYRNTLNQVHRENQVYYIEIFMVPSTNNLDKFMLLDYVRVVDATLEDKSRLKIDLSGVAHKGVIVNNAEDIGTILRFFNTLLDNSNIKPYTSRVEADSSGMMYREGGSRVNMRIQPTWTSHTFPSLGAFYNAPIASLGIEN